MDGAQSALKLCANWIKFYNVQAAQCLYRALFVVVRCIIVLTGLWSVIEFFLDAHCQQQWASLGVKFSGKKEEEGTEVEKILGIANSNEHL